MISATHSDYLGEFLADGLAEAIEVEIILVVIERILDLYRKRVKVKS